MDEEAKQRHTERAARKSMDDRERGAQCWMKSRYRGVKKSKENCGRKMGGRRRSEKRCLDTPRRAFGVCLIDEAAPRVIGEP